MLFTMSGEQHRRRLAGDQRGGDDDVDVPGLIGEKRHFSGDELGAHLLGVAALALTVLIELNLEELGAQALHLLLDRRPRVDARTIAPSPRAAPIAARPATPAPITSTLAAAPCRPPSSGR